ncbi:MAG: PP2C family protein-serine/threonine phosphatase [Gemmataceae bacterium]
MNQTTKSSDDSSEKSTVILTAEYFAHPPPVRVDLAGLSHVGKVRPNNEDQFLFARMRKSLEVLASTQPYEGDAALPDREGYFMMVADGMGGRAGGERASAMVVEAAKKHLLQTAKWFFSLDDPDEGVRLRMLREALEGLDRQLIEEAQRDPSLCGMGTTLTAASSVGPDVFIVHVGDSRAYLFHDGLLEQLTTDHTLTQSYVELGILKPEEARKHRLRHVLTNAIGGKLGVVGEVQKLRVSNGDRMLLCTDGLTEGVTDSHIAEMLTRYSDPRAACQALVDAALEKGGNDNITVVVATYAMTE